MAEARLGRVVQAGEQLARPGMLTAAHRQQLEEAVQAGRRAAAEFAEANLRLVVSVARRCQHRGVELGDLVRGRPPRFARPRTGCGRT
jgi:RNA polymerase primary sigma factor